MLETYPKFEVLQSLVDELDEKRRQYQQNINAKLDGIHKETTHLNAVVKEKTKLFLQAEMDGNKAQVESAEKAIADLKKQLAEQADLRSRYAGISIGDMLKEDANLLLKTMLESRDERLAAGKKYEQLYKEAQEEIEKAQNRLDDIQQECSDLSRVNEFDAIKGVLDIFLSDKQREEILAIGDESSRNRALTNLIN